MNVSKLLVKLNFKTPDRDLFRLVGEVDLGDAFDPTNASVEIDIGGAVGQGTMDAKGRVSTATFTSKLKNTNGVWSLNAKAKNSDFKSELDDNGLSDVNDEGRTVSLPVSITIDGQVFLKDVNVTYASKEGKNGTAKSQ